MATSVEHNDTKTFLRKNEFLCEGKEYEKYNDSSTVTAEVRKYDYGYTSASICFGNSRNKESFEISGGVDNKESKEYLLHKVDRMIESLTAFKAAVKEASKEVKK